MVKEVVANAKNPEDAVIKKGDFLINWKLESQLMKGKSMAIVITMIVIGIIIEAGINFYFWRVTQRWAAKLETEGEQDDEKETLESLIRSNDQ